MWRIPGIIAFSILPLTGASCRNGVPTRTSPQATLPWVHSSSLGGWLSDQMDQSISLTHGIIVYKNSPRMVSLSKPGDNTDNRFWIFPNLPARSGVHAASQWMHVAVYWLLIRATNGL